MIKNENYIDTRLTNSMTHFNGFINVTEYGEEKKVEYIISNKNNYNYANVVIEFEFTEISYNDEISVEHINVDNSANLLSAKVGDLLNIMKYDMPNVYANVVELLSKTNKNNFANRKPNF